MTIFLAIAAALFGLCAGFGPHAARLVPDPGEALRSAAELLALYTATAALIGRMRWRAAACFGLSFALAAGIAALLDWINGSGQAYLAFYAFIGGAAFILATLFGHDPAAGRAPLTAAAIGDTRSAEELAAAFGALPARDPRKRVMAAIRELGPSDDDPERQLLGLSDRLKEAGRTEAARWAAKRCGLSSRPEIRAAALKRRRALEQRLDDDAGYPDFVGSQRLIHIIDLQLRAGG